MCVDAIEWFIRDHIHISDIGLLFFSLGKQKNTKKIESRSSLFLSGNSSVVVAARDGSDDPNPGVDREDDHGQTYTCLETAGRDAADGLGEGFGGAGGGGCFGGGGFFVHGTVLSASLRLCLGNTMLPIH